MPSVTGTGAQARDGLSDGRHPRSARYDSRQRGLLSIATAAALPLVHRRTTPGRAGTYAQRVGPRARALRQGDRLRWRHRSGRSRRREATARQASRVLRNTLGSRRHLFAKGSYVPVFERGPGPEIDAAQPIVLTHSQESRPAARIGRTGIWIGALALVAIVVVVAITWNAFRGPADAPVQLLPLASLPGVEGAPALSPDGEVVAFAWAGDVETGPSDIYIKAVGSEALRRLTETPSDELSPAWSPDGHTIAFIRVGEGVFTMSQLGGAERRVSAIGNLGDLGRLEVGSDSRSRGNHWPLWHRRVVIETLERRRVTQAPVGAGDWRFQVSPDGTTLAFIRYERPGIADLT